MRKISIFLQLLLHFLNQIKNSKIVTQHPIKNDDIESANIMKNFKI